AFLRGSNISFGVGGQQQTVGYEGSGCGFNLGDIVFKATIAFFQRRTGVTGSFAFGLGAGKRNERAVAVAKLARLGPIDVPSRIGAEWHGNRRQLDARNLVSVSINRADPCIVEIV